MAHLWVRSGIGEWDVLELKGDQLPLDDRLLPRAGWWELSEEDRRVLRSLDHKIEPPGASLVRSVEDDSESWTLVALPWRVSVNGTPMPMGSRVLQDRDEIQVDDFEKIFFSVGPEYAWTPKEW